MLEKHCPNLLQAAETAKQLAVTDLGDSPHVPGFGVRKSAVRQMRCSFDCPNLATAKVTAQEIEVPLPEGATITVYAKNQDELTIHYIYTNHRCPLRENLRNWALKSSKRRRF